MSVSIDQLNAISTKYIMPQMHDNIFDSNPLLKKIKESGSYKPVSGGVTIDVPLNYAAATSGWYSGASVKLAA